jgi:predicted ATPase
MNTSQLIAGRFEIRDPQKDLLGRGGMADVYRGTDTLSGETVAIKVLKPEIVAHDPELVARFVREGEALRGLDHPNIVKMIAAIEEEGRHVLIMEHVGGGSLEELIQEQGPLPLGRALEITLDLSDALTRAHRLGVVHRDLKPGNVLLAEDGTPRLTDFGMAHLEARSRLTQSDVVLGTLHYLSPEACDLKKVDARADIWALGVMLYEMLTGERPFRGDIPTAIITAILSQPVPDLVQVCPELPTALVDLVYRMLEKDREGRIPSARLVGAELERILGETTGEERRFVTPTPATRPPKHNLPQELTPFVGRQATLALIGERLADPDCRLLTLVGPGGSGKTRLAIQAAAARLEDYEHGVYFVSLAPLRSAEAIVPTVADAVGFRFYKAGDREGEAKVEPRGQLLDYLRRKTALIIMDNYEHLLAGTGVVSEILKAAPAVRILATSRARLNVGGEHRFQVGGMDYPGAMRGTPTGLEDTATYSAVQLFLQGARRARPDFELTAENVGGVIDVCRLVEGMPLAIRLAAAWVALLSPAEIAAEIGRSLDLLETDVRDVPERQRSMRAVLDHSWRTLTGREQEVMGALSVFRGGFTREAAEQVAGATLRDLMALVNQSLLHRTAAGRYEIHELARAYAAEKLSAQPERWEGAHEEHSAYYTAALGRWEADLKSARQVAALEEMDREIDNARAAWDWAAERGQVNRLDRALEGLCWFYHYRRRYQELESACQLAGGVLKETATGDELRVLARILAWQGWALPDELDRPLVEQSLSLLERPELAQVDTRRERAFALWHMGALTGSLDLVKARELYEQSLALYRELGDRWWAARMMWHIGWNVLLAGAQRAAKPWALESLEGFKALGDPRGSALALELLTKLDTFAARFEQGERWAQENLAICRETGDQYQVAEALWNRGVVHWLSGEFVEARSLYEECAAINDDLGVDEWMVPVSLTDASLHLGHYEYVRAEGERQLAIVREWGRPQALGEWLPKLGFVAVATRAYGAARSYLQEAVAPLRDAGLLNWLGSTLAMLGVAHRGLGERRLARDCILEALQLAGRTEQFYLQVNALSAAALSLLDRGQPQLALEVYALASRYPLVANSRWFEDVFGAEIAAAAAVLPPDLVAAAQERGRARDLDATIAELIAEFEDEPAEPLKE